MDLAEPCDFDRELAHRNIREIRPRIRILEVSAKSGAGMDEWLKHLEFERLLRA
jgi:hydrogenase nickel incorporation protein HypB